MLIGWETAKFMASKPKIHAEFWLKFIRENPLSYGIGFDNLRWHLERDKNLTLADIGTSEEELKRLEVEGCKAAARFYIGLLERDSDSIGLEDDCHRRGYIEHLFMEIDAGGLLPADIGTCQVQLNIYDFLRYPPT